VIHKSISNLTSALDCAGFTPCNEDKRYDVPSDSGICTEVETLTLLFGFVRALRPKLVVETGSNVGCASRVFVEALAANGDGGRLATCDIDEVFVERLRERYGHIAYCFTLGGLELVKAMPQADLYFLDSSDESRMAELEWLRLKGKPGAVVLVHDTALYLHVQQVVASFPRHLLLPGPRGLGVITL
jgi:predicted O-methyltransferase YrrM